VKEEARKLLAKAERALHAAETLVGDGDFEFAAGRAYYAMLHAAQALLREHDLRYRRHAGVHGAFGERFAKAGRLDPKYHRWLLDALDDRLRGDYDVDASFDRGNVNKRIEQAREFLAAAKVYLESRA